MNTCLRDNSSVSLTGSINLTNTVSNTFTFAGATPTEISYVHGVTSAVQTQPDNAIKKSGHTALTGNAQFTSLTNNYIAADAAITTVYTAADVALSALLTSAYTTAIANKTSFSTLTKNNIDVLTSIPASVIRQGRNAHFECSIHWCFHCSRCNPNINE